MECLTITCYDFGKSRIFELFNPVNSWAFIQSDLTYIDSNLKPFYTQPKALEQVAKEAPDVVIFNQNGDLEITDSAATVLYRITCQEYPYRSVLKYLEKRKILVKKTRLEASRFGAISIFPQIDLYARRKYLEDDTSAFYTIERTPFDVQQEFIDLDKEYTLDADTRLRIEFATASKTTLRFYFKLL